MKAGSIRDELKTYPNVFWAMNTTEDIHRSMEEIKQSTYVRPQEGFSNKYSRQNQMQHLVDLIQEIT
jgi:hypothetical protein